MKNSEVILDAILFKYLNSIIEKLYLTSNIKISITTLYYIDQIYLSQEITPSQLADVMKVSRSAVTKMIKKLKTLGYIKINKNQIKGNSYTLALTEEGRRIHNINICANKKLIELLDKHLELNKIDQINTKLRNLLAYYSQPKQNI